MVGLSGLEPPTSRLSGVRSNQLSYRPTSRGRGGVRPWSTSGALPPSPRSHRLGDSLPGRRVATKVAGTRIRRQNERRIARGLEDPEARRPKSHHRESRRIPMAGLPRKEVIQPHLPVRLPCYDLAPITGLTLGACSLTVSTATSGTTNFRGLTGGVYKARERIHRCLLISDY
jgi:hypothetical protein